MSDDSVIGLLLAGGRATRMGGGDKCLRLLAGRPLLAHVIERLGPQVSLLLVNANRPEDLAEAERLVALAS